MSLDISSGVAYAPLPCDDPDLGEARVFCHDQQKFNLLWLAVPLVNIRGLHNLQGEREMDVINRFMDQATRDALRRPPLEFLAYWENLNANSYLKQVLDHRHISEKAQQVHLQLSKRKIEGNVVHVKFGRR